MSNTLKNPHDKLFRKAMTDKRVAKEFFQHHLPEHIKDKINFDRLAFCKRSFVDEEFKAHEADVLYQTKVNGQEAYLYILAEHQSSVDHLMAFRLMRYMIKVMDFHLLQHETKTLPLVYPLVFYHGKQAHPEPTDLFALFGDQEELARELWNNPYHLIDVSKIEDTALQERLWSGTMEFILKHVVARDFATSIAIIKPLLIEIEQKGGDLYINLLLNYVIAQANEEDLKQIDKTLTTPTLPIGEKFMKLGEYLRQQGFNQGVQDGMEKGIEKGIEKGDQLARRLLAKRMLAKGMGQQTVSELTELPLKVVNHLE